MIKLIKNNNIFFIEIDGNIDENYFLNEEEINMLMDYLYVSSIQELEENLNLRLYSPIITHKDVFIYIKKNFNIEETIDFDNIVNEDDYNYEIIPRYDINNKKQLIHKNALYNGVKFFFENTKFKNGEILFTGGTSLLLGAENEGIEYFRFSLDLDFSFYDENNNITNSEILIEIERLSGYIIDFLESQGCIISDGANWRMIKFELPGYGESEIKIDWMPNYNVEYEIIYIDNVPILKSSNEDIVANKLLRLNERDIKDIEYLINKLDFEKVIYSLEQKSLKKYGDTYRFLSYINTIWNKHSNNKLVNLLLRHYNIGI